MPLETATYISQLVSSNPAATDQVSQGDDHLRLIKAVLQSQFTGLGTNPVNSTAIAIDFAVNAVLGNSGTITAIAGSVGSPSHSFGPDPHSGLYLANAGTHTVAGSANSTNVFFWNPTNFGIQPGVALSAGTNGHNVVSVPIGGMILWPSSGALPSGEDSGQWTWCNGGAISRSTYSYLFGLIGTFYGAGDGSNTFNVPDFRELTPMGLGGMGGTGSRGINTIANFNVLGATVGEQNHTLSVSEMPNHAHPGTTATSNSTVTEPNSGSGHAHSIPYTAVLHNPSGITVGTEYYVAGSGQNTGFAVSGVTVSTSTTVNMAAQGGGSSHNTVQPSIPMPFIIRIL